MKSSWSGKALRVDLSGRSAAIEEIPREWQKQYLGGRGLNAKRLFDEIPAGADPLGPENKLFFGVGPLNGTLFPGQRFNVSGKSPQTGILGDSNAGGFFGTELRFAGLDQLILEGESDRPLWLFIRDGGEIEFRDAQDLVGLDTWETNRAIRKILNDDHVQIACIGPAAERGVVFSGIFTNLVRACARTGMGRVMAQKNVKAIAVRGKGRVDVHDPDAFAQLMEPIYNQIQNHPDFPSRIVLGTTRLVTALNSLGMLGTKNHQTGVFPNADRVSGERLAREFNTKQKGCFACTIPCSRYFIVREGPYAGLRSEGPEFEALGSFTSRIMNDDLPLALKCVDICNRAGVDAITASACISFAMECYENGILTQEEMDGLDLHWGNGPAALRMLELMVNNEGFGSLFADGLRSAARRIGRGSEQFAMEGKGLEVFMGEPRGIKGYGLGLAVASRGADHLRAEPFFELLDDPQLGLERFGVAEAALRMEPKGKGRVVKYFEDWCAISDSFNVCKNTMVCMEILPFDRAAELLAAATGLELSGQEMHTVGERINGLERLFNVREGLRREHDTLPKRFTQDPLPPECGASAGSIMEIEPMLDEYYEQRGWEVKTGLPRRATLYALGLEVETEKVLAQGIDLPE